MAPLGVNELAGKMNVGEICSPLLPGDPEGAPPAPPMTPLFPTRRPGKEGFSRWDFTSRPKPLAVAISPPKQLLVIAPLPEKHAQTGVHESGPPGIFVSPEPRPNSPNHFPCGTQNAIGPPKIANGVWTVAPRGSPTRLVLHVPGPPQCFFLSTLASLRPGNF